MYVPRHRSNAVNMGWCLTQHCRASVTRTDPRVRRLVTVCTDCGDTHVLPVYELYKHLGPGQPSAATLYDELSNQRP